ncbi:hypothetical protein CRV24_001563 [Beauveria bassiana]|nr:hypothetical protein CRV24_001563 [Beauveria bassiana]
MADCVMDVISDYGIASKIGYFVKDNADNNSTMMRSLSTLLLDQYQTSYDAEHHRLRCNGHIINLAAQSFLFGANEETPGDEDDIFSLPTHTELETEQRRRRGALGKLHNIAVYIQRSPQRLAQFRELSGGRNLVHDNSTRWNSWYAMIRTAIKLKTATNLFCHQYQENSDDLLLERDWQDLQKLNGFLFLKDRSPVYIAALVLSPQWKWDYIDNNWPADWRGPCRQQMQDFWVTEYKSTAITVPSQASETTSEVKNSFHQWAQRKKGNSLDQDEYTKYLLAPIVPEVTDPRSWWLESTQRKSYPALSVMALDVSSIPAMSAEPERLFSGTKITITDRRSRLGIESIEAIECLKS